LKHQIPPTAKNNTSNSIPVSVFLTFKNIVNYTAPLAKIQELPKFIKTTIRYSSNPKKNETKTEQQFCLTLI